MKKTRIVVRKQAGVSTALMLVFLMGFVVIGGVALTASVSADKFGERQKEKLQAANLAETGVQVLYESIRNEMRTSSTYPFRLNSTDVTTNDGGAARIVGSYEARVVSMNATQEDVGPDTNRQRVTVYNFVIEGTGRTNFGITSTMRAKFVGMVQRALERRENVVNTGPALGMMYIPRGAMASNTKVSIYTNDGFRTRSSDGGSGHIIANEGVEWQPVLRAKSTFTNTDLLDVQGQFVVNSSAYDHTVSSNGIGNDNGVKNYRTPAISGQPGWPTMAANSVVQANRPVNFADSSEVDTWVSDWRTAVSTPEANRYDHATLQSSDIVPNDDGDRVIETPAYLDGNLFVQPGQTVKLVPTSSNPRKNVVYVRGNVTNIGLLKNLGVKVVVEGTYSDGPSAAYQLDTVGSPFTTMGRVLQNAALVSVRQSPMAINIVSNANSTTGLIYAAKGGINIGSVNAEIAGALVSGGRGTDGGIRIGAAGGSGSFTLRYTPETGIPAEYDPTWERRIDVNYVEGDTTQWFTPGKLQDWVMKR